MNEQDELRQRVAKQIEQAFADTPYPDEPICPPTTVWHYEQIEAKFKDYHWRDLPFENLFQYREVLTYLSDTAFRFYLPAYLLAVLLHPEEVDTLLDRIVDHLSPSNGEFPQHDENISRKAKTLTISEIDAVIAFLNAYVLLIIDDDERWQLGHYWHRIQLAIDFWTTVRDSKKINL